MLVDKTIVITGVGRAGQIGDAVAAACAEQGAAVALVGIEAGEVRQRAASLVAAHHRATSHVADLTSEPAVAALAQEIGGMFGGRVDALVNVAGGFAIGGPVADSDPALLERQFRMNVTTAYLTTRAFLPLLRPARGAVVYFAAAAVLPGGSTATKSAYAIAKHGVLGLMRAVAEEEREHGVRANAVAPGNVRTAANVAAMGDTARFVERDAVAAAVAWLCSDASGAVSGEVLRLE